MDIQEQMQKGLSDIAEIKAALLGSPFTENKGLVFQVNDNIKRIGDIEKKISAGQWLLYGASAIAGVGLTKFLTVAVQIFSK